MAVNFAGPRTRGFTLLELIVVLGLLSVVFAIALPQVSASLPGLFVDQAARTLAAELQLARVKAVSRNTRMRIIMELDRRAIRLEQDTGDGFVPEHESPPLPGGVTFDRESSTRVSGSRISITFQPRGNTADNATIVLLASGGIRRRVIVNSAGRVRME